MLIFRAPWVHVLAGIDKYDVRSAPRSKLGLTRRTDTLVPLSAYAELCKTDPIIESLAMAPMVIESGWYSR